ncbi:2750_t:CDS:2 [Paraglomus occultum]|uniref:2750_t:CDS:1 n=1 Tax=Paraglomus occultum TaxID=144539 RepID=A0A9N8VTE4_9GLOM|nr:2750_t:CDS:2 [Paraglomus occultum]
MEQYMCNALSRVSSIGTTAYRPARTVSGHQYNTTKVCPPYASPNTIRTITERDTPTPSLPGGVRRNTHRTHRHNTSSTGDSYSFLNRRGILFSPRPRQVIFPASRILGNRSFLLLWDDIKMRGGCGGYTPLIATTSKQELQPVTLMLDP